MNKIKIKYWKQALREIDEYFDDERLEGVAGADRRLVTADAKRPEEQDGEEQRAWMTALFAFSIHQKTNEL